MKNGSFIDLHINYDGANMTEDILVMKKMYKNSFTAIVSISDDQNAYNALLMNPRKYFSNSRFISTVHMNNLYQATNNERYKEFGQKFGKFRIGSDNFLEFIPVRVEIQKRSEFFTDNDLNNPGVKLPIAIQVREIICEVTYTISSKAPNKEVEIRGTTQLNNK